MKETLVPYEETTIVVSMAPFLKTLLRITFLMPAEGQKCTAKHIVKIFAVSVILGTPWFIGLIGFLYKELQSGYSMEILQGIYYLLHGFIFMLVALLWLSVSDEIYDFIRDNETYKFGLPKLVFTRRWTLHTWSVYFIVCLNFTAIIEIISSRLFACMDVEDEKDQKCVFYFPAWFPFDVENVYLRNYILFCRWMIPFYLANIMSSYVLIPEHLIVMSAKIRHLDYLLKGIRLNKGDNFEIMNKKLRFCVKYHTEILRLVNGLNNTLGVILFPENTVLVILLSLTEFKMYTDFDVISFSIFICWFAGVIIFCECGNMINEEYDQLRWTIYGMNWYEMHPDITKTYLILLGSVQKPVHFIAQPVTRMNRECFMDIVKSIYSFFMYLKNFQDDK